MAIRNSSAFSIGKDRRALQSYGLHKGSPFIASKDIVQAPGPGQYTPKYNEFKEKASPSWSLSKDQREKKFGQTLPGPGEYRIPTKIGEAPRFIMGLKLEKDLVKDSRFIPGPGDYNPIKSQKTLKYTMSGKVDTSPSPQKTTPGPGTYSDMRQQYYSTLPGSKMGRDSRKSYFLKSASHEKPGPGNYSSTCFTEKSDAPKFGFGSSVREKNYIKDGRPPVVPGPGRYDLKTVIGPRAGVPVYSMPGRRKDLRPKTGYDAPDAGIYNPTLTYSSVKPNIPKYSVGKSKRDGELNLYTNPPGSTTYTPNDTLTKTHFASWRIGSEERPAHQHHVPQSPGPGTYESKSALDGPKFSMRSKHEQRGSTSPGPGQYEPRHTFDASIRASPAYSPGTQTRVMTKELNENPGPGSHESQTQLAGYKFGFGSSEKLSKKNDNLPGPGYYKIPSQVGNVPSYAMPNREDKFKFT